MNRGLYLRWGGKRNRADELAEALGTRLVSFSWQTKSPWLVPLRYAVQFAQTIETLVEEDPDVVLTQHTQPFCSLAAVVYARLFGGVVVTDCHNGPFVDETWTRWPLNAINRYVYKNATINLVHNEGMRTFAERQQAELGTFRVMHDGVPSFDGDDESRAAKQVVAICSFHHDEPIDTLLQAAALLSDVSFVVTGDVSRLSSELLAMKPDNVRFSGFLPDKEYDLLLQQSAVAIALSTRDNLLMRACQEAIGAATPFVTSEGPVARDYLSRGTVFVENQPESVAEGVRDAVARSATLRADMKLLREERRAEWLRSVDELKADLGLGGV